MDLWLDASVTAIATEGGQVQKLSLRTRSDREVEVRARAYVLATGGIENARLLLVSELGGPATGRYMMNHPKN